YLLLARKLSLRMLVIAVASASVLVIISAIAIDGSIIKFSERLALGVDSLKYLGGGHTVNQVLRIDNFQLGRRTSQIFALIFGLLLAACWSLWTKDKKWS